MRQKCCVVVACAAACCLWATSAFAQASGLVIVGVGVQKPAKSSITQSAEFPIRQETASFQADYPLATATAFDVAGGALFNRTFGLLIGVSRSSKDKTATETISLPHPFFFNQYATDTATTDQALTHSETAVHLDVVVAPATTGKVRLYLFAGPSYITVKQNLVSDVDLVEMLNPDTLAYAVRITGFHYREDSPSAWGFNGGATVAYMVNRNVGVGGTLRVSRAKVDLLDAQLSTLQGHDVTQSVSVGGVSATFGVTLSLGGQ